jgi:hypothetical protein
MILNVHKEVECDEEQKERDDIKMKSMKMLRLYDRRGLRAVEHDRTTDNCLFLVGRMDMSIQLVAKVWMVTCPPGPPS